MFACFILISLSINNFVLSYGFDNFTLSDDCIECQFSDVSADDWFWDYVCNATNLGFFRGRTENTFEPSGMLTLGETVTLASRLHSIFNTGAVEFVRSVPFYSVYVSYALAHGIISGHGDYNAPVTRKEFAVIMRNALPTEAFEVINDIPPFGILDVSYDTTDQKAIYTLYRAGILTGSDQFGTFFGSSNISRAEASAVMVRLAAPAARVELRLPVQIPVEELFLRSTDAVFMIETFDDEGFSIRTGSGFFISPEGLAVTALHVLTPSARATITLFCGETFSVSGIRALDTESNLAIIEIDSDKTGLSYLTLADSDMVAVGNTIFAIGSPHNLINSISEGIIAYTSREFEAEPMIQFTAPISFGSGGGPLLNTIGQVVGVPSSSFTHGQNLNLAIPVNLIRQLELSELITLEAYWASFFAY